MESEPIKTGMEKQTAEKRKSYRRLVYVIAMLIIILAVLGYVFRNNIIPKRPVQKPTPPTTGKSAEQIAKENDNRAVQIEFGWQLFDANTGMELWHEYWPVKGTDGVTRHIAAYIENNQGQIEPFIDIQKNVDYGAPVGYASAWGSGFVVSRDGFILTNRHIAAAWSTRYDFPSGAFPGVLIRYAGKIPVVVPGRTVTAAEVFGWVPAETQVAGGYTSWKGSIRGKNTYMNVIFLGTSLRQPVLQPTQASDDHDVAIIKIAIPDSLSPVTMFNNYDNMKPNLPVTVMGYPGVAAQEFVARKSNDPFNRDVKVTSTAMATVSSGSVEKIIPESSSLTDKNINYSSFGDSYQLNINVSGAGNSGGPVFDDRGRVIGIYYEGASDAKGTQISFAVPIKYGLELISRKKVNK